MISRESARFPDGSPGWWDDQGVHDVAEAAGEKLAAETSHDARLSAEDRIQGIPWEVNDHRPDLHELGDEAI